MKKILLSAFILMNIQVEALYPYDNSILEIQSYKGNFVATLNGKVLESHGRFLEFRNIAPGYYNLEISIKQNCNHYSHNGFCRMRTIYAGPLHIQPATRLQAVIDNRGNFKIQNVYTLPTGPYVQAPDAYYCAPAPISVFDFNNLKQAIDDQWYDESKLAVANLALLHHFFTSGQVAEIMDIFWYESSKLAFAKAAYTRVVDPQNYYVVNDAFWYSSSVQSLSDYIFSFRH
ncbi:MAG: DUF4476 domain-containing protein [Chitinophagales bacterium]